MRDMYIVAIFIMIASFTGGILVGSALTMTHLKEDAIKHGVAEWVIEYSETDFSDVKRSFRWKLKP